MPNIKCLEKKKKSESGQIAILGLLIIMLMVLLIIVAIDAYHVLEIRSWAYQAAQSAASDGVTVGIQLNQGVRETNADPSPCVGRATLDINSAETAALATMVSYLGDRSDEFSGLPSARADALNTTGDYIIYPDSFSRGYPNNPARDRLKTSTGTTWTITEPSVAVSGVIPVDTFFGGFVGLGTIDITYFAASSVHQPSNVCP
jgi:hypothetical protein